MMRFAAIAACAVSLAACASGGDAFKTTVATATLQFESEPAGAEVKLSSGQTCKTPCALAVPATDLTANFTLNGFQPASIPVKVVPPDELRPDADGAPPTVRFSPSPVVAELVKVTPARRGAPARRPPAQAPQTTAPTAQSAPAARPPAPAPSNSPWPPAPSTPSQVR